MPGLGLFSHGQVGDCPLLGEGRLSQGGPRGRLPLLDPPPIPTGWWSWHPSTT